MSVLLALVTAAVWAVLCYGLPSFGGAGAMLTHARTHGGTVGLVLVGLACALLLITAIGALHHRPRRAPTPAPAVAVTVLLLAWAAVLLLEWGHAWVAQGGAARKALTAMASAVAWWLLRLASRARRARQLRRAGPLGSVPDQDVRGRRWR